MAFRMSGVFLDAVTVLFSPLCLSGDVPMGVALVLLDAPFGRHAFESFASFGRFARGLRLQQADVFALHGLVHGAH